MTTVHTIKLQQYTQDILKYNMGLLGCSKTSVRKYHYLLHINPEENSYHFILTLQAHCIPVNEAQNY